MLSEKIKTFAANLPGAESAVRFYSQLAEKYPSQIKKLDKDDFLLSDVLTLAAYSPFLAATLLQHPDYIWWLNRQKVSAKVRGKEEILESLARFALTNSQIEPNILLARFRRRELLKIYLRDIRNLGTIAEITEEISNLADAILEYALRLAQQELDNRYGTPLEIDRKERAKQAQMCIVALGKLGSGELNYASDIDLLFLYSNDGGTSGQGSRGAVTNREYFVKVAEFVTKLVGGQTGEGAAYRVDLRLRPHGRVGALAIPVSEAVNYYKSSAQSWERQVLIRSRACAGEARVFHGFFESVKSDVFSKNETIENALQNVRLSKEKINLEKTSEKGFNVKLGKGGIREIEFIAQALQIAFGGKDEWLRAPHTLISLSRLADRQLLSENELTELFESYAFLRRLEHRLQMENGLQTHLVPNEPEKRLMFAKRMDFNDVEGFDIALKTHSNNVNRIFSRVFDQKGVIKKKKAQRKTKTVETDQTKVADNPLQPLFSSLEKSDLENEPDAETMETLYLLSDTSPHFTAMVAANPQLISDLPNPTDDIAEKDYLKILLSLVENESDFVHELAILRKTWSRFLLEIVVTDIYQKTTIQHLRRMQTKLAEASIETALHITKRELERQFPVTLTELPFAVLGLGKLGGGGMDYGSDLDLILIYGQDSRLQMSDSILDNQAQEKDTTATRENVAGGEKFGTRNLESSIFQARAVEIFVTVLSSLTRDGSLYRVDLRLRPDGKNGATSSSKTAFLNYLENRSAMWEWLAYVKLRGAAGDAELAKSTENEARKIIHRNARKLQISDSDSQILSEETRRIRQRLLETREKKRKRREIDIKFGEGGMLDVYFAVRFLQLRDDVPDDAENRSTLHTLEKLRENNSLSAEDFENFRLGHAFLNELDHNLRLTIGRSTLLPTANRKILEIIIGRMKLATIDDLLQNLTLHRLNIRASFENILADEL